MTNREQTVISLEAQKAVCLYRGGSMTAEQFKHVGQAVLDGGARFIEVTIDHNAHKEEAAFEAVDALTSTFGDDLTIGVGTVLAAEEVNCAHAAGARFIVSPVLSKEVVALTHELDMMSIPGVITPTEVMQAVNLGADFLKVFPIGELGLGYAKAVLVPLGFPRYLAVCKMTPENFEAFLGIGFKAAAISSSINNQELIKKGQFSEISRRIAEYVEIASRY
ncbi:bifunctional 4-hydroxy-2-oxoglutarate aldolase/2-dehydro-3-deoxy-phosphogluconate aldolase [Lancefieldella rimae]